MAGWASLPCKTSEKNRQPYRLPNPLNAGESSINSIWSTARKVKRKIIIFEHSPVLDFIT